MTKRMSYTVGFKLKTIELAEATSNRNARKELGINEKACAGLEEEKDGIRQTTKSKQSDLEEVLGQNLRYLDTPTMRLILRSKLKSKFSPQKYGVRLILGCDLYSGKYSINHYSQHKHLVF